MDEFEPITYSQEYLTQYWQGPTNMFARYFTYLQRCIGLFNEAKYFIALFGLGVFKSDIVIPWWILILGGLGALPLMIVVGRWHLFKVQKATEFINTQHGSVTGFGMYNMNIQILKTLKEINSKLK